MAHCLNKNKPHQNETRVCYCTTYIQRLWSPGSLISRRFRNVKLQLQACLCVHVNKLYLINTSCRSRVWPCCVCASQISSMTHDTKKIICHVYIICHFHIFLFWKPECKFWKNLFEHDRVVFFSFVIGNTFWC